MSDNDVFTLIQDDDIDAPQGRCKQCKLVYGKPQKHNESALRCASCDYPFGETYEGVRALAMSLQDTANDIRWNVRSQKVCYTWLRLVRDGLDLTIETCGVDGEFGQVPDWYESEVGDNGWDSIISPPWRSRWDESSFDGTWNNWALEEGLCPGQPFLVEMKPPRWYKCSYEYDEWDVEYDWDIVARIPRSAKQAARSWDLWRVACAKNRVDNRRAHERAAYKRTHDVEAMYLCYDTWGMNPYEDYGRDDGGYIVALCSSHGGGWLIQGRSPSYQESLRPRAERPEPSFERAFDDLIRNVQEHHPHLTEKVLRSLSRRPRRY